MIRIRDGLRRGVRGLKVAMAVLVIAGASGCASSADQVEESVGTDSQPTTYDSVAKPIPTAFLFKKTGGNRCCTGPGATHTSCTNLCADSKGLVTTAGAAKAADYYKATGQDALTTLDAWKAHFGFPNRRAGETLYEYRRRTQVVVYYNRTELGLGRELGCSRNANGIGCFVTNYGDRFDSIHDLSQPDAYNPDGSSNGLWDAITGFGEDGLKRKNTVVISYVRSRETAANDGKAVQFAAFKGDGTRLNTAQLDTMGARPIPQICMTCHGGVWDADSTTPAGGGFNGIARYARFLPLITSTVTFSNVSGYRLADQEDAIRVVNQYAWKARGEPTGGTPARGGSLTERQELLMSALYATHSGAPNGSIEGTLTFHSVGRQRAETAYPAGWSTKPAVYNIIALPYCDTCHMAMDTVPSSGNRPGQGGVMYEWLRTFANMQTNRELIASWTGATPTGFGARTDLQMPHAQNAFARFWGDPSTFDGSCTWNGMSRPKAECFLVEIGFWPSGRPPGATFTNTSPELGNLLSLAPASGSSGQADCGQANLTFTGTTSGINSGRRVASVFLGGNSYINQCADGCVANQAYCPGSETAGSSPPNRFPNVRMECRPFSAPSSTGNCFQCGRLYQPACQQVGSGCRTDMNPSCTSLPACHEGVSDGAYCWDGLLSRGMTTSQSSTWSDGVSSRAVDGNYDGAYWNGSVTHTNNSPGWWRVDLGSTKKVTWIDIYNRSDCCFDRLANFVVDYATVATGPYFTFSGGDFTGTTPITANKTQIALPKPVDARYVRVRLLNGSFLSLAEVDVWGW